MGVCKIEIVKVSKFEIMTVLFKVNVKRLFTLFFMFSVSRVKCLFNLFERYREIVDFPVPGGLFY